MRLKMGGKKERNKRNGVKTPQVEQNFSGSYIRKMYTEYGDKLFVGLKSSYL